MGSYLEDVYGQPEALRQALQLYESSGLLEDMKKIGEVSFERLIFSGMGSSHFCAIPAGIYLKQHGRDNQVISTGELLYYERELVTENTMLVLISQSGESAEIVRLIEMLPEEINVIAVTNDRASTLARRGQVVLPLCVQQEDAVTTRTYLASVCMCMLLAETLLCGDAGNMLRQIRRSISLMEHIISRSREIMKPLEMFLEECPALSVMGRGYSLGSVQAGALFFREIVKQPAMAFDEAEFKHGPLEMVEEGFRAVVFAPDGPTAEINCRMAESIASKGGRVVLITDDTVRVHAVEGLSIIRLGRTPEYLAPLCQILPVQFMAQYLAKKRKLETGTFRWGSKIMGSEV